jgi:arylformamidase
MTQPATSAEAIAAMGNGLGPDVLAACRALFDAEQTALAQAVPVAARDLAYGPHPRQCLDLYGAAGDTPKPVLLFVHGGGFILGDKGDTGWANAAVGRMAAQRGWIGAVMNYRLAPDHPWPAGSEDVSAAVDFLRANVAAHGGDPEQIVVMGTSAGAVHVSGFLKLCPDHAALVRGAILLSGLYGFTPLDPRDELYYGADNHAAKAPLEAVVATTLPLLIARAQYDPPRFQAEFMDLVQARLTRHTTGRSLTLSGHNHYTMAMHLGTSDCRLEHEIASFLGDIL